MQCRLCRTFVRQKKSNLMIETAPWYLEWKFWSAFVAALALLLSQLPPVHLWFRRARLDLEVYARIAITHKVGNPNATAHVILTNTGGRKLRVKCIKLSFKRNGTHAFSLPAQNYYEKVDSKGAIIFTPFSLKPNEEWSHSCNFLNFFNREDEKRYRVMESRLRADIQEKRAAEPNALAEADAALVSTLLTFFDQKFMWAPGEYELSIEIHADRLTKSKAYRFTIFESESDELRALATQYKYGAGVYWDRSDIPQSLWLELHEVQA